MRTVYNELISVFKPMDRVAPLNELEVEHDIGGMKYVVFETVFQYFIIMYTAVATTDVSFKIKVGKEK